MVDVFISYSRSNEDVVAHLAEAVKAEGYSVWWDAELPPHLSYGDVITEKIGAAKAAIVVWSAQAAASEWVRAEADVARNQKKLIQVSVDDTMPPLPFNQIQYASISNWQGEADHVGWRKVKASLAALCRGEEAEPHRPSRRAPPPPPPPQRRGNGLVVALLAVLVLLVGAGVYLLWVREPLGRREAVRRVPSPAPERAVPAAADPPQVFPDSSERRLAETDVAGLTPQQLGIARNEIYARHGRIFQTPALRRHFSRYSWYAPRSAEVALTAVEQANVRLLQEAEAAKR